MYKKLSQEEMDKRRELYAALKKDYLENVCEGHYDEVCETLDFYEESVIHYGEGFDTSWLFFIDELKYTYGEYELIRKIQKIIQ